MLNYLGLVLGMVTVLVHQRLWTLLVVACLNEGWSHQLLLLACVLLSHQHYWALGNRCVLNVWRYTLSTESDIAFWNSFGCDRSRIFVEVVDAGIWNFWFSLDGVALFFLLLGLNKDRVIFFLLSLLRLRLNRRLMAHFECVLIVLIPVVVQISCEVRLRSLRETVHRHQHRLSRLFWRCLICHILFLFKAIGCWNSFMLLEDQIGRLTAIVPLRSCRSFLVDIVYPRLLHFLPGVLL